MALFTGCALNKQSCVIQIFSPGIRAQKAERKFSTTSLFGQSGMFAVAPFHCICYVLVAGLRTHLLLKVFRNVVSVVKASFFAKASAVSLPVLWEFENSYVVSKIAVLWALLMQHRSLVSFSWAVGLAVPWRCSYETRLVVSVGHGCSSVVGIPANGGRKNKWYWCTQI